MSLDTHVIAPQLNDKWTQRVPIMNENFVIDAIDTVASFQLERVRDRSKRC